MRILKLTLLCAALGVLAGACASDPKPVTTGGGEATVDEAEKVLSIKRMWQNNSTDTSVPADQRLYCWYTEVERTETGANYSTAEVNTSGQCDWKALANQAGKPEKKLPGENTNALDRVIRDVEFAEGSGAKWDCAALEVTTNKRTFTAYDCSLDDRTRPSSYADILSDTQSKSAEEAAWRLNQLLYLK